jgi:hypothetical protein
MEPDASTRSNTAIFAFVAMVAFCALYLTSYLAARGTHTLVHRIDYVGWAGTSHSVGPGDGKPLGPVAAVIYAPLCMAEGAFWSAGRT